MRLELRVDDKYLYAADFDLTFFEPPKLGIVLLDANLFGKLTHSKEEIYAVRQSVKEACMLMKAVIEKVEEIESNEQKN